MKKLLNSDALELSGIVANSAMNRVRDLRRIGLKYQARKHRIVCEGRKDFTLNYRYLGADDAAGPTYRASRR
jgi:hypothetical protein